jgi:serine protease Do
VVAGSKKIEVIFSDGTKADATVIRKNEDADLALIKVDKTGLNPLPLCTEKEPEIGIDVWAIGTPKSIELGQSVSKGILSGLRKANDVSYVQTDVSLNGGNSGGPIINKQGTVLGIVTSKLIGVGTEGIGFAISTEEVFRRLKVEYGK